MTAHRRLDQILQSKGKVSERQIREALIKQSVLGGRLGEHLLCEDGVREPELVDALSEQYGLPGICLEQRAIEPSLFDKIPQSVAEQHRCVPFEYNSNEDKLSVAFANPDDRLALRAVTDAAHPTRIVPYVGAAVSVRDALAQRRLAPHEGNTTDTASDHVPEWRSMHTDRLLDLLELAVSSLSERSGQTAAVSGWVARLAVEVCERLAIAPEEIRRLRLAALVSDIADWRRGPSERNRPESLARSLAVVRDLNLPWDVVSILNGMTRGRSQATGDDLLPVILSTAWAISDTSPSFHDHNLDEWQSRVTNEYAGILPDDLIKTAFTVLRVRSLRRRLGDHPHEVVVIGSGRVADELLDLLQNSRFRAANARYWQEGLVLLERRRPDLVCVIEAELNLPPSLLMETQLSEHGIGLDCVILVQSDERQNSEANRNTGDFAFVAKISDGAERIAEQIHAQLDCARHDAAATSNSRHHSSGEPAVTGRLADLGLPDLVQVLSSGSKTALVYLSSSSGTGSLWFDRGRIAGAKLDNLTGDEAFFSLLRWTKGHFEVHIVKDIPDRNISTGTTALLLEGFRRLDESERIPSP